MKQKELIYPVCPKGRSEPTYKGLKPKKDLIKEDDPFDRWSLGHVLASVLWFFAFYISVGVSNIQAFYLSFGVMYLYEILFDMTKIEDKEGFSMQDIGADFVGSILALLITIIKL